MNRINQLQHPLVEHHLCTVRDKNTRPPEFRAAAQQLASILAVHATADLPTETTQIETPIVNATCHRVTARIGLVPILRAGLGMVDPLQALLPDASVWHLGVYRNEETAEPVHYYDKIPHAGAPNVALVLDPMLATGGSVDLVIRRLQSWGVSDIRVLSIIASRPGVDRVAETFPDVRLFVAAIDESLNSQSYIVPGLGDAGDRIFGTE